MQMQNIFGLKHPVIPNIITEAEVGTLTSPLRRHLRGTVAGQTSLPSCLYTLCIPLYNVLRNSKYAKKTSLQLLVLAKNVCHFSRRVIQLSKIMWPETAEPIHKPARRSPVWIFLSRRILQFSWISLSVSPPSPHQEVAGCAWTQ